MAPKEKAAGWGDEWPGRMNEWPCTWEWNVRTDRRDANFLNEMPHMRSNTFNVAVTCS